MSQAYYDLQEGPETAEEEDERLYAEVVQEILGDVEFALSTARRRHPGAIHSAHEGYAVMLEELDEVKAEVWRGQWRPRELYKELQHVAAMAIRMAADLGLPSIIDERDEIESAKLP